MKSFVFAMLLGCTTAALADDLPAGHPSVRDAFEAAGTQTGTVSAPLPNQGKVISTMQSMGYTYIEVEQDGKNLWLAVPKVELEDGSQIRYGHGLLMSKFYSKGLNREFDEIYMLDRIELVK